MTIAPSAAVGKTASSGRRNSRASTTEASATRECSWVRLPSASPTTVRLPLLLTGKPWMQPAAEVGGAEGEQLLVGRRSGSRAGSAKPCGEHVVGVRRRSARRAPGTSRATGRRAPTAGGPARAGRPGSRRPAATPCPGGRTRRRRRPRRASPISGAGARGKRRWTTRSRTSERAAASIMVASAARRGRRRTTSSRATKLVARRPATPVTLPSWPTIMMHGDRRRGSRPARAWTAGRRATPSRASRASRHRPPTTSGQRGRQRG